MANRFHVSVLTGANAKTKYSNIETKDDYTLYLLETGQGYLGNTKLFDNGSTVSAITDKFFKSVEPYTLTEADLTDTNFVMEDGMVAGDSGLLFVADNDNTNDGTETKYFIKLTVNVDSVAVIDPDNIQNKLVTDKAVVDYMTAEKLNTIDAENPSDKIPTESAIVAYITELLADKVTYKIDPTDSTSET